MLKNHLKIALRNLKRQPGYTFINVGGLALGMATFLVIGLFVQYKRSYDRHLANSDRVYRLITTGNTTPDGSSRPDQARLFPGLIHALESQAPGIESATQIVQDRRKLVTSEGVNYFIEQVLGTDPAFFRVFPYQLLRGEVTTALDGPGKIVLTASEARRLFGAADPIGRVLRYDNQTDYEVTGIVEDPPAHTHFQFDALRSFSQREQALRHGDVMWGPFWNYNYVSIHEQADPMAIAAAANTLKETQAPAWMKQQSFSFALEPVSRIHLYSKVGYDIQPQGDVRYLRLFGALGILILLLACINYMNLATARSVNRAREVGVRKVVGAYKGQLVSQFLVESLLTTLLAVPVAVGIAYAALPYINQITEEVISFRYALHGQMVAVLLGGLFLVGLLSGSYPALVLSRFHPVQVLKGRMAGLRQGMLLRKGLIVLQFTASLGLVLVTLLIQRQLDYLQQKNLGFDEELVLTIDATHAQENHDAILEALNARAAVASATSGLEPGVGYRNMALQVDDPHPESPWELSMMFVGYDYVKTMGLHLVQGRDFDADSDVEGTILLNEAAAKQYGIAEDPLGQRLVLANRRGEDAEGTVVGMVTDFHNGSLHEAIQPLAIVLQPGSNWTFLVRLAPGNLTEHIASVEAVWNQFVPDRPFEFSFLDERIETQYLAEERLSRLVGIFSLLAIVIASLGLYGLVAFTATSRTKELGIRKVLGASVVGLVGLLSKDFFKLVALGFVLAVPMAFFAWQHWVESFAYRAEFSWGIFVFVGLVAMVLALVTVSYQTTRAALADPIKSLRYE